MTALHLAAKHGHVIVLDILRTKMSLEVMSKQTGFSALHVAAQYGQIEIVRELLTSVPATIKSLRPASTESFLDVIYILS